MLSSPFVDASSHNNGNVMAITNLVDGTRSQQFTYDQLNRLLTAETTSTYATSPTHCWGEAYVYDNATTTPGEFGNLTNINVASSAYNGCTQESLSVVASAANQITTFSYDASGNTLNDTHNSYTWNAESEIKTAAGVTYTYDGDGDRLQKSSNKIYWYGAGSEILDESDSSGNFTDEYVYFGGKRVAHRVVSGNVISYYGGDFLGSARQIYTSASALCYDADFYPFGGERIVTNTCSQNYKFTGKERDAESGNDYFKARYYGSSMGRFLSPDPISGTLANPQSLNRYVYVLNNPLILTDPSGMIVDWEDSKKGKDGKTNAQRAFEKRLDQLKNSKSKSDQAKGASLGTTYDRLQASKATFEVVKPDSSGSSRGDLEYDGNNHFTVNLKGDMTNAAGFTDNQKIAHEFEHGRQVLDGELSYQDYTGTWKPWAHDRTDESKGFAAGFDIESASPGQGAFINSMQQAIRFGGVAGGAIRLGMPDSPYKNLEQGPNNVDFKSPAIYSVPQ